MFFANITAGSSPTPPTRLTVTPAETVPGGVVTAAGNLLLAPGTYVVFACADDAKGVDEGNEANNCAASATPITVVP